MRIAVLGANGHVGKETVRAAVADGHHVVALARRVERVETHPQIAAVPLDLDDPDALTQALQGSDAVVVALGRRVGDPTLMRRALPVIAQAARAAGVVRVVQVGAFGAGTTRRMASWRAQSVYATLERGKLLDHDRAVADLDTDGLEWTTLLPVRLREGMPLQVFAVVPVKDLKRVAGLPLVPFTNLARLLVDLAVAEKHTPGPLVVARPGGLVMRPEYHASVDD